MKKNCNVNFVDATLTKCFYKLGVLVAHYPGYFLLVPFFLTIICITGYQRVHYEMNVEYLFSPENGPAQAERYIVESYFKINDSYKFNPSRVTRQGRYARIMAVSKTGGNMLNANVWKELRTLDDIIRNISVKFGEEGRLYQYADVCARWGESCFENDILNLDAVMVGIERGEANLTFPVMLNPVTWDAHVFPAYFGGTILDENNFILSVPCVQLMYFIRADNKWQDERARLWEDQFLKVVQNAEEKSAFKYISTTRFASRSLDVELEKNTRSVIPYFGTTFSIMALFSMITCMMSDWVRSKPILGLLGNLSAVMGTMAAYGFLIYCGVDFIGINFVSPFLMCGIGIDDTFVMLAAWRRTPVTMSVPERMGHTMSDAAVSITITSLTDIVSLWIGEKSPFPAIEIFCLYSGVAVFFIFLWHITFFAACVALCGYAEQKNLHSITMQPVLPASLSQEKSRVYRFFCSGGINSKDPEHPLDNPENALMVWFRDSFGWMLNQWPVKAMVILGFALYLGGAIYGTTKIQEGLQRQKLSHPSSYSVEFYNREDFYFRQYPYRIQVVIAGDVDYWDESVQDELENLTRTFEKSPFVGPAIYTESWMRSFLGYIKRNKEVYAAIDSEESFINVLKKTWLFESNPFSIDVVFNEDETKILATRFIIQTVNITDGNVERDMVQNLRQISQQSSFNVTVFHPYFLFFDQFELVKPTSIKSMIMGGVIMMIISFVFIPNLLCSVWVALSIISIEVGVFGYMALWDVNLDSISMVNLIMCVGFSVDFTAHMCYAYMSSKAESTDEKVMESLYSIGLPIFQSAISTILAVAALLFAGSYIFLVFFKMIFLVIILGALHGLFLLPVLLSLFGPGTWSRFSKDDKKDAQAAKTERKHGRDIGRVLEGQRVNDPKHYGIPLHGMVHGVPPPHIAYNKPRKGWQFDKDLGLGTSEDSSESSSYLQQQKVQGSDKRRDVAAKYSANKQNKKAQVEGWKNVPGYYPVYKNGKEINWRIGVQAGLVPLSDAYDRNNAHFNVANIPVQPKGHYRGCRY